MDKIIIILLIYFIVLLLINAFSFTLYTFKDNKELNKIKNKLENKFFKKDKNKKKPEKNLKDKLHILNSSCKDNFGNNYIFDLEKKKCINENIITQKPEIIITKKPKNIVTNKSENIITNKPENNQKTDCKNDIDCNFGSGECISGKCVCKGNYEGKLCEINTCFNINCENGICEKGKCNCFPDWAQDKNGVCNINVELSLCGTNKCGQQENRGLCSYNNDLYEDGACICKNGWSGDKCENHKCFTLVEDENDKDKFIKKKKCLNNSFCELETGKCICNVLYDESNYPIKEKGDYKINYKSYYYGSFCENNNCLDENGVYKCNNGECNMNTGECSCDFGYVTDEQNKECNKNQCSDCGIHGTCKKIKSMCLNGFTGECSDNIDKDICLKLPNNTKDYSYYIDGNLIKVTKEFMDTIFYQKNKTCRDFINEHDQCEGWINNSNKNLSTNCLKQIWLNLGCNDKKSYQGEWIKNKNFNEVFKDYVQWRSNNCGEHGIQQETESDSEIEDNSEYECICEKGWFKDNNGKCNINPCLKKNKTSNDYIKNNITGLYVPICNPDRAECILDENKNFKECFCKKEFVKENEPGWPKFYNEDTDIILEPSFDFKYQKYSNFDKSNKIIKEQDCDICRGNMQGDNCANIDCNTNFDDANYYVDPINKICKINLCNKPDNCNSAAPSGNPSIDSKYWCNKNNESQCDLNGCDEGFHFTYKKCFDSYINKEINCDDESINTFVNDQEEKKSCREIDENLITISKDECELHATENEKILNEIPNFWKNYPKGCFIYNNNYYYSKQSNGSGDEASCKTNTSKCLCKHKKIIKLGNCNENICKCENGIPLTTSECIIHDKHGCKECNPGYIKFYENENDYKNNKFYCKTKEECLKDGIISGDECKRPISHGCKRIIDESEIKTGNVIKNSDTGNFKCDCESEFEGVLCQLCRGDRDSNSINCIDRCDENHINTRICPHNATCEIDNNTSECECNCINGGTCNQETGICTCPHERYSGNDCSIDECSNNKCGQNDASPRGTCNNDGSCTCNDPFFGNTCQYNRCKVNNNINGENKCNNGGTCNINNGTCSCPNPYHGDTCESNRCSHNCSGHGTCNVANGSCSCNNPWHGNVCQHNRCSHNCSGHGTCNVENGNCSCDNGYHPTNNNKACSINVCTCPGGTKVNDGPDCTTHNQIKCKSCGSDFTKSNNRCKCNKEKFVDTWDTCNTCKGDLEFKNGNCTCKKSCTDKSRGKCHENWDYNCMCDYGHNGTSCQAYNTEPYCHIHFITCLETRRRNTSCKRWNTVYDGSLDDYDSC